MRWDRELSLENDLADAEMEHYVQGLPKTRTTIRSVQHRGMLIRVGQFTTSAVTTGLQSGSMGTQDAHLALVGHGTMQKEPFVAFHLEWENVDGSQLFKGSVGSSQC
jgi:hypothetical protein